MNEQVQVTVEVSSHMTSEEVELWRLAHSKAVSLQEAEQASVMLFKSLRERDSKYLVRQLGFPEDTLQAAILAYCVTSFSILVTILFLLLRQRR